MTTSYFADIPPIRFEGADSVNPLAYRYYDKDRIVLGKRMEDHLRMAVCYWHTFCSEGADMFGPGTVSYTHLIQSLLPLGLPVGCGGLAAMVLSDASSRSGSVQRLTRR